MSKKRYSTEQVIMKLREIEVMTGQGETVTMACRQAGITEQTYYHWRKEYGGLKLDQARKLKDLDKENSRLEKLVADLSLDNAILREVSSGKVLSLVKRREAVNHIQSVLPEVSERRACRVIGQARATQRRRPQLRGRECLAIVTRRSLKSFEVLNALADLFLEKGLPQYIRSDNGPEFVAIQLRKWLSSLGVSTLFIEPGSPWENGYIESFNGKFRDEYLAGELFDTLKEAQVLTER